MPSPKFDPTATGPTGLATANHVVRLLNAYTGRGATKARTSFGDDLVTAVARDLLTKGERSLVRDGRADLVLDLEDAEAGGSPLDASTAPRRRSAAAALFPGALRLCTKTLANLCTNDIVVFPRATATRPADEALVRRRHAAARRL